MLTLILQLFTIQQGVALSAALGGAFITPLPAAVLQVLGVPRNLRESGLNPCEKLIITSNYATIESIECSKYRHCSKNRSTYIRHQLDCDLEWKRPLLLRTVFIFQVALFGITASKGFTFLVNLRKFLPTNGWVLAASTHAGRGLGSSVCTLSASQPHHWMCHNGLRHGSEQGLPTDALQRNQVLRSHVTWYLFWLHLWSLVGASKHLLRKPCYDFYFL